MSLLFLSGLLAPPSGASYHDFVLRNEAQRTPCTALEAPKPSKSVLDWCLPKTSSSDPGAMRKTSRKADKLNCVSVDLKDESHETSDC